MIITIFRALVLSADVKPENDLYARLYTDVSSFLGQCFGVLPGSEFAD